MRILLFTHAPDIDGMGAAVLAKLAFNEPEIVFCETFDVDKVFIEYFINRRIYNYDQIFVVDICPRKAHLDTVKLMPDIADKLHIFDHHVTAESYAKDYDFVTVKVKDEYGKKCCGTSLFYEYLMKNKLLNTFSCSHFVDLTRLYDTWEWKNSIFDDKMPNELNMLFSVVGRDKYISSMVNKIQSDNNSYIKFTDEEKELIAKQKEQIEKNLKKYKKNMIVQNICGFETGVVEVCDNDKNDFAQFLRESGSDLDYVIMPIRMRGTMSFRSIKEGFDVSGIAKKFGGGGHKEASSAPISNVIDELLKFKKIEMQNNKLQDKANKKTVKNKKDDILICE